MVVVVFCLLQRGMKEGGRKSPPVSDSCTIFHMMTLMYLVATDEIL